VILLKTNVETASVFIACFPCSKKENKTNELLNEEYCRAIFAALFVV